MSGIDDEIKRLKELRKEKQKEKEMQKLKDELEPSLFSKANKLISKVLK